MSETVFIICQRRSCELEETSKKLWSINQENTFAAATLVAHPSRTRSPSASINQHRPSNKRYVKVSQDIHIFQHRFMVSHAFRFRLGLNPTNQTMPMACINQWKVYFGKLILKDLSFHEYHARSETCVDIPSNFAFNFSRKSSICFVQTKSLSSDSSSNYHRSEADMIVVNFSTDNFKNVIQTWFLVQIWWYQIWWFLLQIFWNEFTGKFIYEL